MACYNPWDCKESDTTEQLNNKNKDSLHPSIPVNHSDYWEATEKPHTYLHLTLSAHYNCTVWFLVSIWEELTLKTYQALELIRVSSASFLSSHSFRNADVQLYAWVSHANFLKGISPAFKKAKLHSTSPYHPLPEVIDFSCSNKVKPFIVNYKYFPSVLLSVWFCFLQWFF